MVETSSLCPVKSVLREERVGENRFRARKRGATTPQLGAVIPHRHIFFHPDYDRRPWHLTRSADLLMQA
jgi:hypothetical protein